MDFVYCPSHNLYRARISTAGIPTCQIIGTRVHRIIPSEIQCTRIVLIICHSRVSRILSFTTTQDKGTANIFVQVIPRELYVGTYVHLSDKSVRETQGRTKRTTRNAPTTRHGCRVDRFDNHKTILRVPECEYFSILTRR